MAKCKRRHHKAVERIIKMKTNSNLSGKQLKQLVNINYNAEEADMILKIVSKDFKNEGYYAHRLHGCQGCEDYIWLKSESHPCPNCNNTAGRYNEKGKPLQEVFYFSLLPRLEQMYSDPEWRLALRYPDERPRRFYSRSDVFDGSVYKRIRRGSGKCEHFVSLVYCADAVMVDKRKSRSVLPGVLSILNYDPRIRQHAVMNMLLTFLLPPKIKTNSAQKFYALLEEELNELYYNGIAEGKLKGALIMLRADQKGKEFDLGLRPVTSYDGPCNFCELLANYGHGNFKTPNVADHRRFLSTMHPYRTDPAFGDPELRPAPAQRTIRRCEEAVQIVQDPDIELTHYHGYVHLPLFYGVKYFKPFEQSAADLSHNVANFVSYLFKITCPTDALVSNWRLEALLSGRFVEISSNFPTYLDPEVARILLPLDLDVMRLADLRECAKLMGVVTQGTNPMSKIVFNKYYELSLVCFCFLYTNCL